MKLNPNAENFDKITHYATTPMPQLLKHRRKMRGRQVKTAARDIGCTVQQLITWENGSVCPKPETLEKIAEAYKCDVSDFFAISTEALKDMGASMVEELYNDPTERTYNKANIATRIMAIPDGASDGVQNRNAFIDWRNPDMYAYESDRCMQVVNSKSKEILVSGPTRCGKTDRILEYILGLHFNHEGFWSFVVRSKSVDLFNIRESIKELLKYRLDDPLSPIEAQGGIDNFHTLLINGGKMILGGIDRPGSKLGWSYDLVFYSQIEQSTEKEYQTLKTRVAGDAGNWVDDEGNSRVLFISDANPDRADHHLIDRKNMVDENGDNILEWIDFTFTDNPLYYRRGEKTEKYAIVDELDRSLTGIFHDRFFKGLWRSPEGAIFDVPDEAIKEELPSAEQIAKWDVYRACDWGMKDPSTCLWIGRDPETQDAHVFREWGQVHTDIIEVGKEINRWTQEEIKHTVIDNDENRQKLLKDHCKIDSVMARKGPGSIMDGIHIIQNRLRNTREKKPGGLYLYKGARCNIDNNPNSENYKKDLIAELIGAEFSDTKDAPKDGDDHRIDPLRYYFLYIEDEIDIDIPLVLGTIELNKET